jgi:NADPH2:quinone reductase
MNIPRTMKTAAIGRFGPPSVIQLREQPVPRPAPDEILIRMRAAGVGTWDPSIRDGSWRRPGRNRFPMVLGTDGAGDVVAKGARARRFRLGDRVYAYEFGDGKGGFYAEYAAVKAEHAARVPRGLGLLQAGAAAPTALTALRGIVEMLRLRRGQSVLIFGASGAVGTMAVQFAKHRGARVLATASGERAAQLVRQLGADAVIDARRDGAAERLWKLAPDGIDAALAFAGGESLERCLDLVRPGGRVAFPNGIEPGPPRRRRAIRRIAYDMEATPKWFRRLQRSISREPIRVPIAATLPLAQAARAHRRLARGHVLGRMVLKVR